MSERLRVLDLFSGIGGYSLGLERTGGFETVAFCEIEDYPVRILNKHWPKVPVYRDVRTLTADTLRRDGIAVDVICGGWPCQDISSAGTGLGLDGARSGLWAQVARLAGELRPRMLILENSSNLLSIAGGRDFGRVLGDLAALGYDAEWHCLPAAAFDAPHIRDRLWIVATRADAYGERTQVSASGREPAVEIADQPGPARIAADADIQQRRPEHKQRERARTRSRQQPDRDRARDREALPNPDSLSPVGAAIARAERFSWLPEPGVGRVVHGASNRVDRIHALGNCNPPIVIETIGRALLASLAPPLSDSKGEP